MNMTTLLDAIRDAIHDDAAVLAWCDAAYTRAHRVFVGVDARHPPDENMYPLVHVFPVSKTGGYEVVTQGHQVAVTCGIYEAADRETSKDYVTEKLGVSYLEAFRKLVETAVVGCDISDHRIDRMEVEYETLEYFPFFLCNMTFTIVWDFAQGDDPFR